MRSPARARACPIGHGLSGGQPTRFPLVSDRSGDDARLRAFGAHLRQIREERGLTIEGLAHQSGVGVRQLARVEAGRGSPSVIWLLKIADGLGTEPAALLRDL